MTAEERQMQRADRYAAAWYASAVEQQEAANARADAYAAECARWLAQQGAPPFAPEPILAEQGGAIGLDVARDGSQTAVLLGRHRPDGRLEIVADRIFDERTIAGARASYEALRAQQAPPPPVAPAEPEIARPGSTPATPVASRATYAKGEYARDSGDPGASEGYRPPWAAETVLGRRR